MAPGSRGTRARRSAALRQRAGSDRLAHLSRTAFALGINSASSVFSVCSVLTVPSRTARSRGKLWQRR